MYTDFFLGRYAPFFGARVLFASVLREKSEWVVLPKKRPDRNQGRDLARVSVRQISFSFSFSRHTPR